jgi:hypothetical protein
VKKERRERRGERRENGRREERSKTGMILTTAKNQQKHGEELFGRNSSI